MNRVYRLLTASAMVVLGAPTLALGPRPGVDAAERTILRAAIRTPATGFDPKIETASTIGAMNANVVESLVTTDYDGVTIRPQLATEWRIEGSRSWIFKLRPRVKFHDGTPFDAAAAKFSLERMAASDSSQRGDFSWLESVQVVDPLTIRITAKYPYAPMLSSLAFYQPYIVSPAAVQKMGDNFGQRPVGTGPFKFASHVPKQKTVIVRNDEYWGPKPTLAQVEWLFVPEDNSRLAGLLAGELDLLTIIEPSIAQVVAKNPQFQVLRGPADLVDRVGFNTRKKPFDDVRVRRAVVHAINRKLLLETVFGGDGVLYDMPLAPTLWGYDRRTMEPLSYPYDPEKAKRLLAEAGYPSGFKTTFLAINRPDHRQIAEVVQEDLKKVGIQVEVRTFDFATVAELSRQGQDEMYIIGTYGVGDPDRVFPEYESSTIGVKNRNFWSDPEVDRLIALQRTQLDEARRIVLVRQAAAKIREAVPDFALRVRVDVEAISKKVKGYRLHPLKWVLQTVSVEQ